MLIKSREIYEISTFILNFFNLVVQKSEVSNSMKRTVIWAKKFKITIKIDLNAIKIICSEI